MRDLPLTAMDRIIKKATGLRVGLDAREELARVLEKKGAEIAAEEFRKRFPSLAASKGKRIAHAPSERSSL